MPQLTHSKQNTDHQASPSDPAACDLRPRALSESAAVEWLRFLEAARELVREVHEHAILPSEATEEAPDHGNEEH